MDQAGSQHWLGQTWVQIPPSKLTAVLGKLVGLSLSTLKMGIKTPHMVVFFQRILYVGAPLTQVLEM